MTHMMWFKNHVMCYYFDVLIIRRLKVLLEEALEDIISSNNLFEKWMFQ